MTGQHPDSASAQPDGQDRQSIDACRVRVPDHQRAVDEISQG